MTERDIAWLAFLTAAWLFLVIALAWPDPHCPECPLRKTRRDH